LPLSFSFSFTIIAMKILLTGILGGIVMSDFVQLLIETCEFPNNTSPGECLARKNYRRHSSPRSLLCQSLSRR